MENNQGNLPSTDYCQATQSQYGLTMPVLIDDRNQLQGQGLASRHVHFVIKPQGEIVFRDAFNDSRFEPQIQTLLGP